MLVQSMATLYSSLRRQVKPFSSTRATPRHPDHIGGAAEVFKAVKVLNVIDNGQSPSLPPQAATAQTKTTAAKKPTPANTRTSKTSSLSKFYDDYKAAVSQSGAHYENAKPGTKYDLGGGALLTILAPSEPLFTRDKMTTGGNDVNANSIVARLDYGSFSMMLAGDAEDQTEHRLLTKELDLRSRVLKIAHHGSKYASSGDFLKRVQPEVAILSCGAWNRYGHPSQA